MQMKIPCVYMRGGTSKAVIFKKHDLPADPREWHDIFLKVMGTPDPKQIDGMGGTVSSTSKIAVLSRSTRPGIDIDYDFYQVDINRPNVDHSGNCGNISSTVGPFAIDEEMVVVTEPETLVRIYNINTDKVIESRVQVENGKAKTTGDTKIMGVPGTGSKILLDFLEPGGAVTGKLFPTGHAQDVLEIPDFGPLAATLIDCANPLVIVRAADIGLTGREGLELMNDHEKLRLLETIRCVSAQKMGFVDTWQEAETKSAASPKIAFIAAPADYESLGGGRVAGDEMDLLCRAMSMGSLHKAYPMTNAIATAAAAKLPGTLLYELIGDRLAERETVRLGHTSGISKIQVEVKDNQVLRARIVRTARRIMDGNIYIRR